MHRKIGNFQLLELSWHEVISVSTEEQSSSEENGFDAVNTHLELTPYRALRIDPLC
jgi:hypothetical protein